ncbi:MAG: flagellar biosynthetic protein FliO [Myxococcota bacterium]
MKLRLASVAVASALLGGAFLPSRARAEDPPAEQTEPPVRVYDTGDYAAVVIRGANADVDNIRWRWGKMHVPIDAGPKRIFAESFGDETVKRVALIGGESPRVMVLLRHGDKMAKKITAAAEIEPVDGGFRILIPRKKTLLPPPPPEPVAPPTPDAPPVVAAPAAAVTPAPMPVAPEPAPAAAEPVQDEPVLPSMPEPTPTGDADEESLEGIATASTQTSQAAWMGVMTSLLLLAACGGALVWAKRRNANAFAGTKFEVLGNQSLGGKSRLVLLGLGDRRMLLSVSESGTALVDKWSAGRGATEPATGSSAAMMRPPAERSTPLASLEFDAPRGDMKIAAEPAWLDELRGEAAANDDGDPPDAESSAVTGLLELRRRGAMRRSAVVDEGAPGDDEDRWVEALAAQLRAGDA